MKLSAFLRRLLIVLSMLSVHGQASAQLENITLGELALAADFCLDVQAMPVLGWSKTTPSPRAPKWIAIMGEPFWAMHHYCWARIGLERATRGGVSAVARNFAIGAAISDFNFVIKNSPPDFVMLPEIYYRIGDAQQMLEDYGAALEAFAKSRSLKRDYWPPYVGEAKMLVKLGKRKEAQDLLKQGLKIMPSEPNLVAALERASAAGPHRSQTR